MSPLKASDTLAESYSIGRHGESDATC